MAQTAAPAAAFQTGPVMQLSSDVCDYGEILQNSDPVRKVKFTNTGTEPLIVLSRSGEVMVVRCPMAKRTHHAR